MISIDSKMTSKSTEDAIQTFKHQNNIFVTSTNEISAQDLQTYFMEKLSREDIQYPKGTVFYFIVGFHHSVSAKTDGKAGETDFGLTKDFYDWMIPRLKKFCGNMECQFCERGKMDQCNSNSIWVEMEYQHELVQLSTKRIKGSKDSYELSEMAINELKSLARRMSKQKAPSTLVLASCFSYYSEIGDVLRANGILSMAQLAKDIGDVTEGKAYKLDGQQAKVINSVTDVGRFQLSYHFAQCYDYYLQF